MSKEQDRRAAILESLRAGKTAKEIVDWFGYSKTQVYEIAKTYREADNKDDVTSDRASHSKRSDRKRTGEFIDQLKDRIDQSPGTSMAKLAKDMGVHRATVSRAVHQDLHYKSYVLRRRQLLTDAMKVNRKIKIFPDLPARPCIFIRYAMYIQKCIYISVYHMYIHFMIYT